MKRWTIRKSIVWVTIVTIPVAAIFWHRIPTLVLWAVGVGMLVIWIAFGWYDLIAPLKPGDPAHEEEKREREFQEKSDRCKSD